MCLAFTTSHLRCVARGLLPAVILGRLELLRVAVNIPFPFHDASPLVISGMCSTPSKIVRPVKGGKEMFTAANGWLFSRGWLGVVGFHSV